jgi:hypothetical protein
VPCLNSTASGSSRCPHDPNGFPPRRQTAAQRRAYGHKALIDLLAGFYLFCLINILLPQVAEKIESLADEDYLAMSFIRIAAAEVLEGGPFRRTVQGLAAADTRYGVLTGRLSEAMPILLKVKSHRIRGDGARPNPAAAPRSAAFSRAIRPGVRDHSPRVA